MPAPKTNSRTVSYRRPGWQWSPYPFWKRLRYLVSRLFGTRLQKSQNLYFVSFRRKRFKRLILRDSYLASEIERNLERFGPSEHFPRLITRYEHEIWVEFVPGPRLRDIEIDDKVVDKVADFYAAVYRRQPGQQALSETPFPDRLDRDLVFLNQVGMLADDAYRDLQAAAKRLAPQQVWVGFDYTDPVLKNLVIAQDSGRVCAVDVESLLDRQLIGTGVAKACERWLEPYRELFLEQIAGKGIPQFRPYFPYVELCYLASWTKMGFLEKKWKFVDPDCLERFRAL